MARQADNKLYIVDTNNKYRVTITQINNIEDAADDFCTFEEVAEMMGIDPDTGYFNCGSQLRNELIKDQLIALRQQAKDAGKKTIIIRDTELMEIFKDGYSVADFVPGMRRIGERLFVEGGVQPEAKQQAKLNRQAFSALMWRVQAAINKKIKFELEIKYVERDRHGALDFAKKFVTFEELDWAHYFKNEQAIVDLARLMWDNIDSYFERKAEETTEEEGKKEEMPS